MSKAGGVLKVKVKLLSRVRLFPTPWTVAYQAPLSMGFSRQEYWSGLAFPPPGDLPDPGIELASLMSPVHYCELDCFISYSDILLLVYTNRADFCLLILYPETLPNFLICSNSFLVILGFSVYKIISS